METNHIQFITREYLRRLERNPRYSLRAFAKALSIDIGTLSQILSGKRLLSYKKSEQVLDLLELNLDEKETFLQSLAREHKNQDKKRLSPKIKEILKEKKASTPNPPVSGKLTTL